MTVNTQQSAVAAIEFALETDEGLTFLRLWNEGEFDKLRREWPEAPESVFIGADPLHPKTMAMLGVPTEDTVASAENSETLICQLPASGFTETPKAILDREFDKLRREWPEAPESVYIGADPLHPETLAMLGVPAEEAVASAENLETLICRLPASGFTETPKAILDWSAEAVARAREKLPGEKMTALLWAYRHNGWHMLMLGLSDILGNQHAIIFTTGTDIAHDLDPVEPDVPDLVEAVHIAGMVARSLDVPVRIGRHENEVNEEVLSQPLKAGGTSGQLRAV